MPVCSCCSEEKPARQFPHYAKLEGIGPWCSACCDDYQEMAGAERDARRLNWRRDYARVFMRWKRARGGVSMRARVRLRIIEEKEKWSLWLKALVGGPTTVAVLGGAWERLEDARGIFLEVMGIDPVDVTEHGRGGGKGARRHPKMTVNAEMTEEEWEKGLRELRKRYTVLEG